MLFSRSDLSAVLATILLLSSGVAARNCQNSAGVANGQCVTYYNSPGCNGNALGSYKPDCSGACFKYNSFGSISVAGDGTYGTRCVAYSDENCQNQVQDTGNIITAPAACDNTPNGKSMRCYYRC